PLGYGVLVSFVPRFLTIKEFCRPRLFPPCRAAIKRKVAQFMRYADAGVNIAVAEEAKGRIRHLATRTFTNGVLGGIGSFGALFALDVKKFKEPILVSSADGVGTKLKVAIMMNIHSTVGGDLVSHCVKDHLGQDPEPHM